ncbi:MAG: TlpA disulfide reductase family protein, partial [Ignavibacteriaceae bacterium]
MKFYPLFLSLLLFSLVGSINSVLAQSDISPQIKIINITDLTELINTNRDRTLLINVWATWCLPCREEFPDLVQLAKSYSEKVRVVGISVDDTEILDSKVIPFLQNQNAGFENYILKVIEPEDFINLLSKEWNGAIPATFIYDKNGTQKKILIGKQSYESFEQAVKNLIE